MRRLREIWERPIPTDRTPLAFAAVAAILLVSTAALIAIPEPNSSVPTRSAAAEDSPVRPVATAPHGDEDEVKATARRFMASYLLLTTGHAPARIDAASPALAGRLTRPLRVPPAARHRHPRLIEIDPGPITAGQVSVIATVENGGITYPVTLQIKRLQGRWLVTDVGAE